MRAIRLLCWTYVVFSAGDPVGEEWCTLDHALQHLGMVDAASKRNSKGSHRLRTETVVSEIAIRTERLRFAHSSPWNASGDWGFPRTRPGPLYVA